MKRSALKRKTPLKRGRKKVYGDSALWLEFKRKVIALDGGCIVSWTGHTYHEGPLQAAHVVPKQRLKQLGLNAEQIYDPDSAMCLCERHHRRNDNGYERVPYARIPDRCKRFAADLRFLYMLDRLYGEDPSPEKEKDQSA